MANEATPIVLTPEAALDKVIAAQAAAAGAPPAGAPPKPVVQAVAAAPAAAVADPNTKAMEAITRKEIAINKRDQAIKAQEAALKDKIAKAAEIEQFRLNAKRDPSKILKEIFGENWYENMTKYQLEGAPPADMVMAAVDERVGAFERTQKEAAEKAQAAALAAQEQEVVEAKKAFQADIHTYVAANKAEGAALTDLVGGHNFVEQAIEGWYNNPATKGQELPLAKAVEITENFLMDIIEKATKLPKMQARLNAKPQPAAGATAGAAKWETTASDRVAPGLGGVAAPTSESVARSGTSTNMSTVDRGIAYLERVLGK